MPRRLRNDQALHFHYIEMATSINAPRMIFFM